MANDRMYLAHIPSRMAVYLGKRMHRSGWYGTPANLDELVDRLFEVVGKGREHRDGWRVIMEANEEHLGIGPARADGLRRVFLPGDPEEVSSG